MNFLYLKQIIDLSINRNLNIFENISIDKNEDIYTLNIVTKKLDDDFIKLIICRNYIEDIIYVKSFKNNTNIIKRIIRNVFKYEMNKDIQKLLSYTPQFNYITKEAENFIYPFLTKKMIYKKTHQNILIQLEIILKNLLKKYNVVEFEKLNLLYS